MLEIQELEVAYGSIIALHRITLAVAAGKIITLVGVTVRANQPPCGRFLA